MTICSRTLRRAKREGLEFIFYETKAKMDKLYRQPLTRQEYQVYASVFTYLYEKKRREFLDEYMSK